MYSCGHSSSAAGASAAQLVNDQDPGSRDAETSSAAQGASGDAQLANQVMLAEYSAMRSEVDQRTSVQWNVIAPQITSTGVIASLAISRVADIVLLLVIPLLSYMLGTRYILNDYHINLISRYIRVAVGSSRTEIFFYASSAGSADVAAQVAREVLARHDVSVPFWTERSSRRDKEWRDVTDEPPADIAAELQAEHEYRQEQEREAFGEGRLSRLAGAGRSAVTPRCRGAGRVSCRPGMAGPPAPQAPARRGGMRRRR